MKAETDVLPADPTLLPPRPEASFAEPAPPTLRRLFLGDDGLRAGWSLLVFVLLNVALSFAVNTLLFRFHVVPLPGQTESVAELPARAPALRAGPRPRPCRSRPPR